MDMGMKLIFAALAVAAGAAVAFQGATNQGLMKAAGIGPALIVNTLVVLAGSIGLWMATGAKMDFFPAGTPWLYYIGGLFGFIVVATIAFVFPKLGAGYAIALLVAGQCLAALVIDHYGLLGMDRSPLTPQRLLGAALVAAGVAVFRI
jgi:bacterial/archaeal transporter family-2 protein